MTISKSRMIDHIQKHIERKEWHDAILVREELFKVDPDPLIRVRIGDHRQKLGERSQAVQEYIQAADLFAEQGFFRKSRALYRLALRLDPENRTATEKMHLVLNRGITRKLTRNSFEYSINRDPHCWQEPTSVRRIENETYQHTLCVDRVYAFS